MNALIDTRARSPQCCSPLELMTGSGVGIFGIFVLNNHAHIIWVPSSSTAEL
jgi:hypothetical protein